MLVPINVLNVHFPDLTNIALLGSGGFKDVYSAEHQTEGHVVLKIMDPKQDAESIRREIIAAQQVLSPRVPSIYGVGILPTAAGDCFWFREQRVIGNSLRECIAAGPLDTTRLLRLGLHSLEALVKAEQVHIVHRDVKPDNIMCDLNSDFWLLDFGIARHLKLTSQTATISTFGKCTPGYAPIEQFRNIKNDIDARTDLFALGVTLYECATGSNPFLVGANSALDVLKKVETMRLTPLNLSFGAADDFRDLVDAMTQKRFDHRPATAQEALDWMQDICTKEGI